MALEEGDPFLPPDIFHLLCAELEVRKDYGTLSRCIMSSKYLANAGAVAALYRISVGDKSLFEDESGENLSFAEQDLFVMRWSILWRSLILSSMDLTMFTYCRHLRTLALRNFSTLLETIDETKYKAKVAKQFFAAPLAQFHHTYQTTGKHRSIRLDIKRVLLDVGDRLTQQAPFLESISEPATSDVLSIALPLWTPRMANLQEVELYDGKPLADETLRNLLHAHCPKLNQLRLHRATGDEPDQYIASFLNGLQPDTLETFQNTSLCGIGLNTCLAFNNHGKSLTTLKLCVDDQGILNLGLLQNCTRIRNLELMASITLGDLKTTNNDVFLEITEWLKRCDNLVEVAFDNIVTAPDLLLPILLNGNVNLRSLAVKNNEGSMYSVRQHHEFHRALSRQSQLQALSLRADPDPVSRDDIEVVMEMLCSLHGLRDLNLYRISDYFSDKEAKMLAESLPQLESLSFGGYGFSDDVLNDLARLRKLTNLTFAGITAFTTNGILTFIEQLGNGNEGLVLSVEMADPDSLLSEDEQDLLRMAIARKVNGRFEYQPLRDPFMPEFDEDDDDD